MKIWKKSISLLLICALLLTFVPMAAASGDLSLKEVALQAANPLPFTDVNSGNWFYPYVFHMYTSGVMNGTTPTRFAPHETFTRAQVLATLFRIHTGRTSNASDPRENNFTDVASTSWTAPYVTWAANNGITPTTSGTFGPNQSAERQEIALYVHRYVINLTEVNSSSVANAQWNAFTDRGQISGQDNYNALRWANNNDIMRGRTATTIVPGGTATRAEAAAMLVRLMGVLGHDIETPPPAPPQPPAQPSLVGRWNFLGVPFFVFEANGRGVMLPGDEAAMDIRWWTASNLLSICITPDLCGNNCILPMEQYFVFLQNGNQLMLTDRTPPNESFVFTRG